MTIAAILKHKGGSVISVTPSASVLEVAEVIAAQRIGAVMVVDPEGGVAGIVSERDVVKALAAHKGTITALTAADVMTHQVVTATPATPVDEALEIMDRGYFRHLPVLDGGKLAGIISIRDVVRYRIMQHEHDVKNLTSYIHRSFEQGRA
jgi:CBS domain-containing protein